MALGALRDLLVIAVLEVAWQVIISEHRFVVEHIHPV
jgi:hypothetical protein